MHYASRAIGQLAVAGLVAVACAACTRANPFYCDSSQGCRAGWTCDLTTSSCVPPDASAHTSCTTASDCKASTAPICSGGTCVACSAQGVAAGACAMKSASAPICDPANGACVQCLASADCANPTPICDTSDDTCRACRSDAECPSLVCDGTTGGCVDPASVAYVSAAASSCTTATGAMASPYCSVGDAVTNRGGRAWIAVESGTYSENVLILNSPGALTIAGQPGASVTSKLINQPVFQIQGNDTVTLRGLTIEGALGATPGQRNAGVYCDGNGASSTSLALDEDVLTGNLGGGLYCYSCTCTVSRSVAYKNTFAGVVLDSSSFTLVNDVLVENGASATKGTYGGVVVTGLLPAGSTLLINDTITGNQAPAGTPAGVDCAVGAIPVVNSIVWANTTAGAGEMSSMCSPQNDDFEGGDATTASLAAAPQFQAANSMSAAWGEYHLAPGSPCVGTGTSDCGQAPMVDFDGTPRGSAIDIGAFQHH